MFTRSISVMLKIKVLSNVLQSPQSSVASPQ